MKTAPSLKLIALLLATAVATYAVCAYVIYGPALSQFWEEAGHLARAGSSLR